MNLQTFNTNAVLSWPSYYGDFTLQSVRDVIASNSWATVAGTPVVVASQYVLTTDPFPATCFTGSRATERLEAEIRVHLRSSAV